MCGIAGIIGRDRSARQVGRMTDAQRHRGPDDEGVLVLPTGYPGLELGLGHRRLAILDLSPAGHQPMQDPVSGQWIVFNGEIYNHLEIRKELGGQYRSTCDTETILAAFRRWGREAVGRFRGMFAFAIWDPLERELFLCRDRLGVKPLYYAQVGPDFLFASELRAILESGLVARDLDPEGLNGFLAFGTVPEPGTIVRGVRQLPAGHWMRVSPTEGVLEVRRYWAPPYPTGPGGGQDAAPEEQVAGLFAEAVDCRLLSDVPLGVFLSGGIDSGAIVASMASRDHKLIRTLTLDFNEEGYGEGPYAEQLAARYRTQHTTQRVRSDDLIARFDAALEASDQPSIDGINTYTVCELARRSGLTVALCGHGGDELFGGYDNFRLIPRVLGFGAVPRSLRSFMGRAIRNLAPERVSSQKAASLLLSGVSVHETYALARGVFWDHLRAGLLDPAVELTPASEFVAACVPPDELAGDPINQVSQLELCFYMRNSLLRDTDVQSMAHGLEVRLPLLDHRLVELVAGMPGALKTSGTGPKPLLVRAMGDALPPDIARRKKQGFVIPYAVWMRTALKSRLDRVLTDRGLAEAVGLRPEQVVRTWSDFLRGSRRINMQHPLALYVLMRWCDRHAVSL
jgi:asparagine synthase (glutamine-hydrolysing)